MPNILPGVRVVPVDKSDFIILNVSNVMAMIGNFEKGADQTDPDGPVLVTKGFLTTNFGTIQNAPDKKSYISAVQMLNQASGVYILNVTLNAFFGGLNINSDETVGFSTGVTVRDSYAFSTVTETGITAESIGTGDGSTLNFSDLTVLNQPLMPKSSTIRYTIAGTTYTVKDVHGKGVILGAPLLDELTIDYANGIVDLTCLSGSPLDNGTNIEIDYLFYNSKELFVLIARSKKTWSDTLGIKISEVSQNNANGTAQFKITEYTKDSDGVESSVGEFIVSRDSNAVDGLGSDIYIEEIFDKKSTNFYCINNSDIDPRVMPLENTSVIYCDGGVDGSTPTTVEQALAVQKFSAENVAWDLFCGAGIIEKTVIDGIVTVTNAKNNVAFIDTYIGSGADVVEWVVDTLNVDAKNISAYTPNQYMSFEGKSWLCPASALACEKKGRLVGVSNQPFMPPAGIGEDRGSINSIKSERVYTIPEITELHKVNVNILRYFRSFGNVIFSDFTLQKKLSATSYQNSVFTLNAMIKEFEKALLVVNFKVINQETFTLIETLINAFMKQLILFDGTIEPGKWNIDFGKNNDTTKDAGKIIVDLTFVFIQLAREVTLNLIYTSNSLYAELV